MHHQMSYVIKFLIKQSNRTYAIWNGDGGSSVASEQTIWQIPHLLSGDSGGPLADLIFVKKKLRNRSFWGKKHVIRDIC